MKESRLFKIVYYILENGRATAPELAKKFEVSVRTIYRDVDVISSAGIPIYVTTGRNGGIQILENYVLDKALFSEKERQDILAALQSIAVVGDTYEKDMLTKLSALFHVNSDQWFEVDFSRFGSKTQDSVVFERLKGAVISHRAAEILYVNSYGERRLRKIYPIKMTYRAKAWYIKAYCTDKADFRLFKLNRILKIEILSEEFAPMEYPMAAEKPKTGYRKISLCFPKEMPEDNWLIGYLLSFGTQVTVIEPTYLQKVLADAAKKIYEKNKGAAASKNIC